MFEFASFFIIILTALVFSQVFGRFHVPWIIALIVGGMVVGPHGLGVVTPDTTLEFFKSLGLVFLMFMAGLHVRFSGMKLVWKESLFIAGIAGAISFATGLGVGILLGYGTAVSILLGIIFISSSIAVLIPFLEKRGLLYSKIGRTAVSVIMMQDIASLIFLAIALQYLFAATPLPLPLFVIIFIITLFIIGIIKWGIPHLKKTFSFSKAREKDVFERDIRVVFAVLVGMVIISEALGLHSIIGAFFAGIILSETIKDTSLKEKIHVLAYGLFIPIFFVVLGAQTNLMVFLEARETIVLFFTIIFASMASKFIGIWISGRLVGFTAPQSAFLGTIGIPQLSTTLAVIAVGQHLEILSMDLVTALIFLSIITTFTGPALSGYIFAKIKKEKLARESKMFFSPEVAREFAEHEQNEKNFKAAEAVDRVVANQLKDVADPLYVAELGGGAHPDRYHKLFRRLVNNPKNHIDWVDASPHMLKLAKEYISTEKYKERKNIISFKNKEITEYLSGLKDKELDIVMMKYVIEYIEDLDELFTLLAAKLKRGGKLVATVNTNPELKSFSTNARYLYRGEEFPSGETKKLKEGDKFAIKFFKESGNPNSGYIEGAETVKYFHSEEKIEQVARSYGFEVLLGDWKEMVSEEEKEGLLDIDEELLVLTKREQNKLSSYRREGDAG